MVVSPILERFMEKSPIPIMVRGLLERVLSPEKLNALFDEVTEMQYTRELLFSTMFELMVKVVTKVFPSIHYAYQHTDDIGVSLTSVYNKLNGLETQASRALVEKTASELGDIIEGMAGQKAPLLPGFRVKMLDGNCIEATEHRLKVLRNKAAGALPGKSLVVYDPALGLAVNVFPCEDGHAQERSLLAPVQESAEPNDVFVMDRNFCVREHLLALTTKGAHFICRHHKTMPYTPLDELTFVKESDEGSVSEHWVEIDNDHGHRLRCRRIVIELKKPTRDGDRELVILSSLPKKYASALVVTGLYRRRWSIETMFQELESHLHSEVNSLGYPKAALFGFCVALVSYNVLAVVKAAMRAVHGEEKIENEVSGYYIAGDIVRAHTGLSLVVDEDEWAIFYDVGLREFIALMLQMARNIALKKYKKHKRGPKKKSPPKESKKGEPHVSTAKLLKMAKNSP